MVRDRRDMLRRRDRAHDGGADDGRVRRAPTADARSDGDQHTGCSGCVWGVSRTGGSGRTGCSGCSGEGRGSRRAGASDRAGRFGSGFAVADGSGFCCAGSCRCSRCFGRPDNSFRCGPACGSAHLVDDGCGICGTRVLGKRRAFGLVWFRGQTRPRAPIPLLHCGSSLVAVASKLVGAPSRRPGVRRSGSNVAA